MPRGRQRETEALIDEIEAFLAGDEGGPADKEEDQLWGDLISLRALARRTDHGGGNPLAIRRSGSRDYSRTGRERP